MNNGMNRAIAIATIGTTPIRRRIAVALGMASIASGCFYPPTQKPPAPSKDEITLAQPYDLAWDAVHKVIDDRLEIEGAEIFPREVELHFADAYDKLLRATEGLETSRDLVAGVRDYLQAKISNDQNEVMKRLT